MEFKNAIKPLLDINPSEKQLHQFAFYYQFLIDYNKITNLTRITEVDEVYFKHFYDSLTLAKTIDLTQIKTLCDMGSGAGFPSIPLKIMYPELEVTIVDSLNKRIVFLKQLIEKLGLDHVDIYHDRVETFALRHQEAFDLVTARALGHMTLISEMGIPMVKKNRYFVAMKGDHYENELIEAKDCIDHLGGVQSDVIKYILPNGYGTRYHLVVQKNQHVKGYPRPFAVMSKKPL